MGFELIGNKVLIEMESKKARYLRKMSDSPARQNTMPISGLAHTDSDFGVL